MNAYSLLTGISHTPAVLCLLLAGCGAEKPAPAEPRAVRSIAVAASAGGGVATYTGEIRSRYETDLSFQVGGKVISRVVDVGAAVRKGAVLAQIEQTDQRLGVDAARSSVAAAQAELDRARSEEARYRDLLERGLTTRASYLAQQTAVKTGQSKFEQASADFRLNEQRLGYTTLRADQDGVVTRVSVEVGSVVSAGQRVFSIARPSELEAAFDVPDSRVEDLRNVAAASVSLLSNAGTTYPARIREISPSADPVTRTYQVKTSIPNPPPSLRLGMTVTVSLTRPTGSALVALPATALFQKDNEPAVWVISQDQTLELRSIKVDRYESDQVMVAAGLNAGEQVVTAGVHRLAVGDKVRPLASSTQLGAAK